MRFFLILCVILVHNFAIAQKSYFPGWVETKDGHRIEGEILFKDKGPTPQEVEFINLQSGESQHYTSSDLKSFEIDGRRYVSHFVDIDVTPHGLQKEDYLSRKKVVSDTIFLTLQVKSDINLFHYQDANFRDHLYIQIEDGELIELIKHEYFDMVLNPANNHFEKKVITNSKYRNQLSYSMRSCPSIADGLSNLSFKLTEIQKQIIAYNKCNGNEIEIEHINEKIEVQYGIVTGAALQILTLEGDGRLFVGLNVVDLDPSLNPLLGVSLDVVFPKNYKKWSLNNMLLFTPFGYIVTDTVHTAYTTSYDKVSFDLSGSYVKLLTKLRYTFAKGKFRPFVNAGFSVAYLSSFKNEKKSEFVTYSVVSNTESLAIEKYKNYEIGLQAGVGLKIGQKFGVEYVFEGSDGMSKFTRLNTHFNRNYFLVTYQF